MQLYESIIEILGELNGKSISGETIAKKLGISRNSVWKAINELKLQGFTIDSVTNRGYRLSDENKRLCLSQIKSFVNDADIILLDSVDSTNKTAKQLAESGAREKTIVIAKSQYAGRGRLGRSFFSPEGGLYFSIILRPNFKPEFAHMITVSAAVAAAQAIEKACKKKALIKWVNDIYIEKRKVCGILTEGAFVAETGRFDYAILGIGINLSTPTDGFPPEISETAAALFENIPSSKTVSLLIKEFTDVFFSFYNNLEAKKFIGEYRSRSFLPGLTIEYIQNNIQHTATVIDIDDNAGLTVAENGSIITINTGDVSIKLSNKI